jgi:gas vesicle protein
MRKLVSLMAGFLTGALVGGVLGLLFAPGSGAELREKFKQEVERLASEIRQASTERRLELESELESLRKPPVKLE